MQTNIRTDLFRVYEPVATQRSYDEIEFPKLQSPSFGFIEKVEEDSEEKPSSTQTSLVVPDPRTQTSTNSPYKSTIIVDKKTQNMEYYDDQGNLKFKSRVSTGKNSGQKQKVGDMRTPEGTFTISGFENRTDKYARDNFGKQPWVYRLNTPGWTGILFHGDANEPDKIGTPASKGCIRLPNDKLEELHNILGEDNNTLNKLKVIIKKQGGNMKLVSKNPVQRFKQGRQILYAEPGAPLPTLKQRGKINNQNWNQSWKNRNTDNDFEAELKRYNETLGTNKFNLEDTKGFQNLLRKYSEEVGQSLGNYDKFSDGKWGTESQSYYDLLASEFKNKQKPIPQAQPVVPQKPTLQQMRRDYNDLGAFFSKQHAVRDLGFNDYSSMVDYVNKNANSAFSQAMRARFGNDTRDWNIADVEGALGVHDKYRRGRFGDFADIQRNLGSWVGTQSGKLANMTEEQWNPKPQSTQTISQVNTQPQSNLTNFYTNNMNQFLNNYNNWKQQQSWYRPQVQEVTNNFTPKKNNNINVYKDRFGGMYYDPNFLTQEEKLISKDPVEQFKQGGHIQKYQNGWTLVRQTNDGRRIYRTSDGKTKIERPSNSYKRENGESQFTANARAYGFKGTPEEITEKVKKWQKAIGAKVDGLFGVETMKAWENAKGKASGNRNVGLILNNGKVSIGTNNKSKQKQVNSNTKNSKSSNVQKQKSNSLNNNGFTKNEIITTGNDEDYAVIQNNKGFTYAIPTRYGKSGFNEGTIIGDKNNDVLYFTVPQELDEEKQLLPIIRKWRDANEGILDSIFYGSNQARRRTERDLSGLLGNGVTFRSVEVPATRRGWTNYWLQKAYLDNSGNLINPTYDY